MAASVASASIAASPPGLAEEVKRLQGQVDELRERLDFISPMVPMVNFVQDFFQQVECEATLQILRLKNAQVLRPRQDGEDDIANAQLETVKFFHFLTDAITTVHGGGVSGGLGPAEPEKPPASPSGQAPPNLLDAVSRGAVGLPPTRPALGGSPGSIGAGTPATLSASSPMLASPTARSSYSGACGSPEQLAPAQRTASDGGFLLASGTGAGPTSGRGMPGGMAPFRGQGVCAAGPMGNTLTEPCLVTEPLAEPGTGGTNGGGEACSDLDGLILGQGSWARAFRQASGPRREALRLLCRSSIVTARELSDDLTVISQEHINECVQIASEMLQLQTLERWAQSPEEAKKFFEARLTEMYQRKFGEVKG